jgi:glycosyltransferase involved in cell wall biosynthesis
MTLRVTVIIPAYNAAHHIGACLAAIRRIMGEAVECIVVDDGSRDQTAAIAEAAGVKVVTCNSRNGPGAARNLGACFATGDLLLFIDSDCVLRENAPAIIQNAFEDTALTALVGAYDENPAADGMVSRFRNLLHAYTHRSARTYGTTFWTGCGVVRRDVFLKLGGFDESGRYMEDVEFGRRLFTAECRIRFDRSLQVCHLKRWTLLSMIRTDIFLRAIPWTRLLMKQGSIPNELNCKRLTNPIAQRSPVSS